MVINIKAFCDARKIKMFQFLFLTTIIFLLIVHKNVDDSPIYREEKFAKNGGAKYKIKDKREMNVALKSKDCPTKFKLLKLQHFNETYDDVIIKRHPNLPKFLTESRRVSSSFPIIPRIRWSGRVFQESWRDYPKFLLYSAHFDTRLNSSLFIHILSYYDGEEEPEDLNFKKYFCKIWFTPKDNPVSVPLFGSVRICQVPYSEGRLHTLVLSCKVPSLETVEKEYPIAVSLVRHECQIPESVLKISASPVEKTKILNENINVGICGKALFYYNNDFSTRLIEWIEILKVLGVSSIFFYKTDCHKNIEKVLDFYEKEGIVKILSFYYPPPIVQEGTFMRLWTKSIKLEFRSVQNLYINDCLLRNKEDFDYLGVFDSDEIPILKRHHSLPELITFLRINNEKPESYFFKWKTFFSDLKSKAPPLNEIDRSHCFTHNIRTKLNSTEAKIFERNGKTFYDTKQVAWAFPHKSLNIKSDLAPEVKLRTLPRNVAYMGHFSQHKCTRKEFCVDGNMEEETALLPFRDKVVQEMNKVLDLLKI